MKVTLSENLSVSHIDESFNKIKPFIRWAGGKQNLVDKIKESIPGSYLNYFEPFLGAGSLVLSIAPGRGTLSDINPQLINAYRWIQSSPVEVHKKLIEHQKKLSRDYYYLVRDAFNNNCFAFDIEQAARFILLVHSSFNGIYRVNKKGLYNVPFGKSKPAIPSAEHLVSVQERLKNYEVKNVMYQDVIENIKSGDFVYFDPPYPAINETSYFQHYSIDKFSDINQAELATYCKELDKRGVKVMISNANLEIIQKLYKGWRLRTLSTFRSVNCKAIRTSVEELLITNF